MSESDTPNQDDVPIITISADGTVDTLAQIVGLLDAVEMLEPLGPSLKQKLAPRLEDVRASAGDTVVHEGDPGDSMYLVASGSLSVQRKDRDLGVTVELATLPAGSNFGEMALITGAPRSANVVALEDARLLRLDRKIFDRLIRAVPEVSLNIAARLAHRLDELNAAAGVRFDTLEGKTFDPSLLQLVPLATIRRLRIVPFAQLHDSVEVATPEPHNRAGLLEVRRLLRGMQVKLVAVSQKDFDDFVRFQVRGNEQLRTRSMLDFRARAAKRAREVTFQGFTDSGRRENQDVAKLLNQILVEGIDQDASDVLIEPESAHIRVRYRVDGRLTDRGGRIPLTQHAPIVSRIKVLAGMDITEKRLPQDGRISLAIGSERYAVRVATVNARYGEKVVLRILDSSRLSQNLATLVLHDRTLEALRRIVFQPGGMTLVTGPTGSGKTTTLYASVMERHSPDVSICTVEDPVEYDIDGVTQVQVNEAIGLSWTTVMRAFMRQSPDVILVGETRDRMTADMVFNAALTGHQVLTSFHTTTALAAIPRLRDMGVERYVMASSLAGVINQRLVRRVCDRCRTLEPLAPVVARRLREASVRLAPNTQLYTGKGCDACGGTGFKGRVAIYEVLTAGQRMRDAIAASASPQVLRAAAEHDGLITLADYATFLLKEGLTVPTEVLRVLPLQDGDESTLSF